VAGIGRNALKASGGNNIINYKIGEGTTHDSLTFDKVGIKEKKPGATSGFRKTRALEIVRKLDMKNWNSNLQPQDPHFKVNDV